MFLLYRVVNNNPGFFKTLVIKFLFKSSYGIHTFNSNLHCSYFITCLTFIIEILVFKIGFICNYPLFFFT